MKSVIDPFTFYSPSRMGEPAHAYIFRRISEEFHKSPTVFLGRALDHAKGSLVDRATRLFGVIPMAEEERERVYHYTLTKCRGYLRLAGERLMVHNVVVAYRRFCPGCIEESPHHRVWWEIQAFRRCPMHGCSLVERDSTGRLQQWSWPFFAVDRYGQETGIPMKLAPTVSSFEYYLLQRLRVVDCANERLLLDGVPLDRVIDWCEFVGRILNNPRTGKTPKGRSEDWQIGFEALSGTRGDLETKLERWLLASTTQDLRNRGIEMAFGWVRRGTRVKMLRTMKPVDDAMKVVFARHGRIGRSSVKGMDGIKHREIVLAELAARYGLHKKGMRQILESIGVPVSKKGHISHFDSDKVSTVDAFVADLISERQAATTLGCKRQVVWGLVKYGRIRGYSRITRRNAVRILIPNRDVLDLLKQMETLPLSGETHSVYKLETFFQRERTTPHDVVERVMKGSLVLANIDRSQRGIAGWRFHVSELAHTARRRPRWKQPPPGSMTRTEAAVLTSFHPRTIRFLVRQGAIRISRDDPDWLDRASVEDFHSVYVKAALHYRELGVKSPLKVVLGATRSGIPIRFKNGTEYYDTIIARSDLEHLTGQSSQIVASEKAQQIWTEFKAAYEKGYSAFYMPPKVGLKAQKLYLASRRCFFEIVAEQDSVIVRKTFDPMKVREWAAFDKRRDLFTDSLKGFAWRTIDATHVAEYRMRDETDIKTVRSALDAIHWHIRTLLPRNNSPTKSSSH